MDVKTMMFSPRTTSNSHEQSKRADIKKALVYTVFNQGQAFYPNYRTNNFMKRYKKRTPAFSSGEQHSRLPQSQSFRSTFSHGKSNSFTEMQVNAEEIPARPRQRPQSAYAGSGKLPGPRATKNQKAFVVIPSPVNIRQMKISIPINVQPPAVEGKPTQLITKATSKQSLLSNEMEAEQLIQPQSAPPSRRSRVKRPYTARKRTMTYIDMNTVVANAMLTERSNSSRPAIRGKEYYIPQSRSTMAYPETNGLLLRNSIANHKAVPLENANSRNWINACNSLSKTGHVSYDVALEPTRTARLSEPTPASIHRDTGNRAAPVVIGREKGLL